MWRARPENYAEIFDHQNALPDALPQAARGRGMAERTTAEAKGRKESFPGQRNPPPPRRLLHETGTRCPVHSGVVYSESLVAETGP